jgi:hypothetical protein
VASHQGERHAGSHVRRGLHFYIMSPVQTKPKKKLTPEQGARRESARIAAQESRWAKAVKTFATPEDLGASLIAMSDISNRRGYGVQSLGSAAKKPLAGRARATAN